MLPEILRFDYVQGIENADINKIRLQEENTGLQIVSIFQSKSASLEKLCRKFKFHILVVQ